MGMYDGHSLFMGMFSSYWGPSKWVCFSILTHIHPGRDKSSQVPRGHKQRFEMEWPRFHILTDIYFLISTDAFCFVQVQLRSL